MALSALRAVGWRSAFARRCATPPQFCSAAQDTLTSITPTDDAIQLNWGEGRTTRFHHFWLRDNCQCKLCRDPTSLEKFTDILDLPPDIKPQSASLSNGEVSIVWPGGHQSTFSAAWLDQHAYDPPPAQASGLSEVVMEAPEESSIRKFNYDSLVADDTEVLALCDRVVTHGFALIRGVPVDHDRPSHWITTAANLISYTRPSQFGASYGVAVFADPAARTAVAYTPAPLSPHTDQPYRECAPGVQLLHCLRQAEIGGESEVLDGFRLAAQLKAEHPEHYATLTQLPLTFRFYLRGQGLPWQQSDTQQSRPLLQLGSDGQLQHVHFSPSRTEPLCTPRFEDMPRLYAAYAQWSRMVGDPAQALRFTLQQGDVLVFNNRRMLHGRLAFTGSRHLEGVSVDWDTLRCRARVLRRGDTARWAAEEAAAEAAAAQQEGVEQQAKQS